MDRPANFQEFAILGIVSVSTSRHIFVFVFLPVPSQFLPEQIVLTLDFIIELLQLNANL